MRTAGFILLLTLWTVTAHSDLKRLEKKNNTAKHDAVLIRTKRRWVLSTIQLEEEDTGPFPKLATQLFNDYQASHELRFHISGQGVTEDPVGLLSVNDLTGEVYVHKPIDRELYPFFMVKFDVEDRKTGAVLDRTLSFNVAVKDKNDNPPIFTPPVLTGTIPENLKEGQLPVTLQAKDNDEKDNDNSRITLEVISQEPKSPPIALKILAGAENNVISQLTFSGCFDYDKAKKYKLLVLARDNGAPALSATATVIIDVTDSNTHPPVFKSSNYSGVVNEMESNKVVLRVSVEDKDTPNTPGSRAKYSIIKGNEEGNYKIETDPVTNEGILTVIKGKDYEKTTLTELEIAVENEEPLFVCVNGKPVPPGSTGVTKPPNTAKVTVKVIDVNDPPKFSKKTNLAYIKEEEPPGKVLFRPEVTDEDSDMKNVRYKLVDDKAKWLTIDPKTGKVTTVKKMDRESPYVTSSTYTVMIHAIDDGEPPATGTGTLVIHVGDINDNVPFLVSRSLVMCGNSADRVTVKPKDEDAPPYEGPFFFSLGSESKELQEKWKLEPTTGMETSLISQKTLPYGNYTIPLKISDHQGHVGEDTMSVFVCDCGEGTKCLDLRPRSTSLHGAAIGILLGAILLFFLLLCFCFFCTCQKDFRLNPPYDGNQSFIKYNEEGGGSVYKDTSQLMKNLHSPDGTLRHQNIQMSNMYGMNGTMKSYTKTMPFGAIQQVTESRTLMSQAPSWTMNRGSTYRSGTGRFSRSYSIMSDWNIEDHLERKISELPEKQLDFPEYHPREYCYEGLSSHYSLDKLSLSVAEDDLSFLQDLGPKFQTLDTICQQTIKEKNLKL